MYLLDTNVVSELRKAGSGRVDANVTAWAAEVPVPSLFLSAVSILELETGVLLIERREAAQGKVLRTWLEQHVLLAFEERIFPIDATVARRCATLHVPDRQSNRDALIAVTALVHGMTVVTRNVADFASTDVPVLNPWKAAVE